MPGKYSAVGDTGMAVNFDMIVGVPLTLLCLFGAWRAWFYVAWHRTWRKLVAVVLVLWGAIFAAITIGIRC